MGGYPQVEMRIGGEWRMRDPQPVGNPYDGAEIGRRAHASAQDLDDAVEAARDGLVAWGRLGPRGRAEVMARAAVLLRERADAIARIVTLEQGKTVAEAKMEVLRAAANIEWDAHEGMRIYGRIVPAAPGCQNQIHRQPIGVVAAFSPWNYPIASPSRKLGAPLAAGCGC